MLKRIVLFGGLIIAGTIGHSVAWCQQSGRSLRDQSSPVQGGVGNDHYREPIPAENPQNPDAPRGLTRTAVSSGLERSEIEDWINIKDWDSVECPEPESQPRKPIAPQPWKPLFYENDFSYKQDACHVPLVGECLKEIPCDSGGCPGFLEGSRLSFGGELRHRFMNEENRLRPFGPGRSTYDLWRWRNYVDFRLPDVFRLYVEMIDTSIFHEDLPATAIDLNRWDLLNAFVDLKVGERDNKPIYLRFGRQELLYGSQHLISPLNWGNTRRNFEGFKITSKGATWDIDAFVTRPVNTGTGNGPLSRFDHERDSGDASRTFNGVYATHHGLDDHTFDLYWLWLREQEPIVGRADGSRHTAGLRWQTTRNVTNECCQVARIWTADIEGAYQFGHDNGETLRAGFLSAKLGHTWKSLLWEPTLTAVYYWGSGDRDPTDDENNTFSVLFPLGHAYWGLIDNLSGQNLNDYSLQATVKPAEKLKFATAVHWFDLDTDSDVLYNVAGAGLGLPGTGTEIGEELDVVGTYTFSPNLNVQIGYLWFWYGTFVQNNLPRDTARQFYVQTTLRY